MQHVLALYVRSVPRRKEDATTMVMRHQCFCQRLHCCLVPGAPAPAIAASGRPAQRGRRPHPHGSLPAVLTHGASRRSTAAESTDYGRARRQVAGLSGPQRRARSWAARTSKAKILGHAGGILRARLRSGSSLCNGLAGGNCTPGFRAAPVHHWPAAGRVSSDWSCAMLSAIPRMGSCDSHRYAWNVSLDHRPNLRTLARSSTT